MRWEYVSVSQIGPTPVVIVTYARSGSTFLGAVLKLNKDVFFIYEPLYFLKEGYRNLTFLNGERMEKDHNDVVEVMLDF
jgi:hypothetical protein